MDCKDADYARGKGQQWDEIWHPVDRPRNADRFHVFWMHMMIHSAADRKSKTTCALCGQSDPATVVKTYPQGSPWVSLSSATKELAVAIVLLFTRNTLYRTCLIALREVPVLAKSMHLFFPLVGQWLAQDKSCSMGMARYV
jgi:hypothetical protein